MSILPNRPLLMICQIRPKIRCSRTSIMSPLPMLTTEQPIPLADWMTMLLFSVKWKLFSDLIFLPGLFNTRSSMVSGTLSLMSLDSTRPSLQASNISNVSVGKGRRSPISGSPARTALIWRVNSVRSSSLMVWVTFADEPWTWMRPPPPPTLFLDEWPGFEGELTLEAVPARGRVGPVDMRCWAGDETRSLEMSCGRQSLLLDPLRQVVRTST